MRPMRWMTCLAIAGLLVACDEVATDPQAETTEATLKVDRFESVEELLDTPYTAFYECANDGQGELLDGWGTWTVFRSGHFTPSENRPGKLEAKYSGLPVDHPDYMGPDYLFIGKTSGDVWVVNGNKTRFMERRVNLKDGNWSYHQTLNVFATRADGEKLRIQGTYQLKVADGEWKMFRINRGACPEIW